MICGGRPGKATIQPTRKAQPAATRRRGSNADERWGEATGKAYNPVPPDTGLTLFCVGIAPSRLRDVHGFKRAQRGTVHNASRQIVKDKAWMEHQFTLHQMLKPKAKESKGSEFTMHQVNPHTVWGLTCSLQLKIH